MSKDIRKLVKSKGGKRERKKEGRGKWRDRKREREREREISHVKSSK